MTHEGYALDVSGSARTEKDLYVDENLGVGTTSPDERLTVAGKVLAEEVIVKPESEWADFVFEEEYNLPTLEEVSAFIDRRGHLPDVPSAESVEQNGLRLGEMDATLLQKIEELTLYAIEQKERANRHEARADTLNARLQQQRTRNAAQQKQIEAQHRRLDTLEHQNERLRKRLNQLEHYLQNSSPDSR